MLHIITESSLLFGDSFVLTIMMSLLSHLHFYNPMSTVLVPDYLVNKYSLPSQYQTNAGTINAILKNFSDQYPAVQSFLYDENNNIRKFINLFLDSQDIRSLDGLSTYVGENSEIVIVIAVAGG